MVQQQSEVKQHNVERNHIMRTFKSTTVLFAAASALVTVTLMSGVAGAMKAQERSALEQFAAAKATQMATLDARLSDKYAAPRAFA